jgi:copper chaperone CopZ
VQSITVEVRVYMHCDACERSVRRTIKKIDGKTENYAQETPTEFQACSCDVTGSEFTNHRSVGVDTVEVDRDENKITVARDFKAHKLLKKIKKKTGKKAEILVPELQR